MSYYIGNWASVETDNMQWMDTSVKSNEQKTKRKYLKKGYELFAQYAELINDAYWKDIFIAASAGKLPKGCTFKNNQIIYKYRNKENRINISTGPNEIIAFLMEHPGMKSNNDRAIDLHKYQQQVESVNNKKFVSWSNIKSPTTKKMLIVDYCDMQKSKLGLTNDERNTLLTLINLHMICGIINASNIVMSDSRIYNINNIIWDPHRR